MQALCGERKLKTRPPLKSSRLPFMESLDFFMRVHTGKGGFNFGGVI